MTKPARARVLGVALLLLGGGVLLVTFATWRATPTRTAGLGDGAQELDAGADREAVVLADPLAQPSHYAPLPLPDRDGGSASGELGDRAKLTSFKDQLKRKAAAGNASEAARRMLRALCRQLGDMSCAH